MAAILDGDHTVYQHNLHSTGILVGVGVGSAIGDRVRVEDHDVSLVAFEQQAPILHAQKLRWHRSHLAHCVGKRQQPVFTNVAAQRDRLARERPRMSTHWTSTVRNRSEPPTVAADHDPVLTHGIEHVVGRLRRRGEQHVGFVEDQVGDDVEAVPALFLDQFVERPLEQLGMLIGDLDTEVLPSPARHGAGIRPARLVG